VADYLNMSDDELIITKKELLNEISRYNVSQMCFKILLNSLN